MSIIETLRTLVGPAYVLTAPADRAPYQMESRRRYPGTALCVVRPADTQQVSAILAACYQARVPVVPQGGNTGHVAGGVPDASGAMVLLSLSRLNRILAIDAVDGTMRVEAGCVLAAVQQAALDAGALFPLSLASQGTCQIGGNLASNAGGINTLRYGNARDLVLGLEVVLPDGQVLNLMNSLRKNNTGYDLKQLFLGSEGTLGVITAAVLKLFACPAQTRTAFLGLRDAHAAPPLLAKMRAATGETVSAFELIRRLPLELALAHLPGAHDPLPERHAVYVLAEFATASTRMPLTEMVEEALAEAMDEGLVLNAVLAESESQRAALWRLREGIPEAQSRAGGSIKNDVSVPVSRVPAFLDAADAAIAALDPTMRPVAFGHVGDGNVHYNISQPIGADAQSFLARWDEVTTLVNAVVLSFGGSVSAEHGIGRIKADLLLQIKAPGELAVMRALKAMLDPAGIMNPGTLLPRSAK
jgi:FAD/FMN-containing dehydrogenase